MLGAFGVDGWVGGLEVDLRTAPGLLAPRPLSSPPVVRRASPGPWRAPACSPGPLPPPQAGLSPPEAPWEATARTGGQGVVQGRPAHMARCRGPLPWTGLAVALWPCGPWPGRRARPSGSGLPCSGIPQSVRNVRTFSMAVSQNRDRPPPSPIQMNFAENIFSPTKAKLPNRLQNTLAGYMRRSDSKTKATAGKGIRQRSGAEEASNRPPRPL